MNISDFLEQSVANALEEAGISFIHESEKGKETNALDFFLPDNNVYIEVKQYHTERTVAQLARADNIILLQGRKSVALFCDLLMRKP